MLKINGKPVPADGFFFDDCHKIYLVATAGDREAVAQEGWDLAKMRPPSDLPGAWAVAQCCGLQFINSFDLTTRYIAQGEDGTVEWEADQ